MENNVRGCLHPRAQAGHNRWSLNTLEKRDFWIKHLRWEARWQKLEQKIWSKKVGEKKHLNWNISESCWQYLDTDAIMEAIQIKWWNLSFMIYFEIWIHEISHKLQIVLDLRFKTNTVSFHLDLRWCVFIFCVWENIYSLSHALCLMGLQNMCDNGSSTHECIK